MKKVFCILLVVSLFYACTAKRSIPHNFTVSQPERISKNDRGFWKKLARNMRFKKVTPEMEVHLEDLMRQGCLADYQMLENKTAYMYSLIPGGGQIYTGEPKKALMYLLSSVLIVPYFISFEDAQSSVDFRNIQYSIDYCEKRLRLSKKFEEKAKNRGFMDRIMRDQLPNRMKNP